MPLCRLLVGIAIGSCVSCIPLTMVMIGRVITVGVVVRTIFHTISLVTVIFVSSLRTQVTVVICIARGLSTVIIEVALCKISR